MNLRFASVILLVLHLAGLNSGRDKITIPRPYALLHNSSNMNFVVWPGRIDDGAFEPFSLFPYKSRHSRIKRIKVQPKIDV
jgi:hypothetical protein